jgi:predicted double-glycine peptidase
MLSMGPSRLRTLLAAMFGLASVASASLANAADKPIIPMRNGAEVAVYNLPVMTWRDIPFRSVVRQQYDYSCGSAALATLLKYHYGRPTSESDAFSWMWKTGDQPAIQKVGFSMLDMRAYLKAIGYKADGFRINLDQLERMQTPAIVLLTIGQYKHFVVIKGINAQKVLVGDPALGLLIINRPVFDKMWNGIVFVIRETPDLRQKPRFNDPGEWSPWSTAPIRASLTAAKPPVSDSVMSLPPYYQITPVRNVELPAP